MCKFFAQDPKNSAVSDVNIKDSFFGRDENQKKKTRWAENFLPPGENF